MLKLKNVFKNGVINFQVRRVLVIQCTICYFFISIDINSHTVLLLRSMVRSSHWRCSLKIVVPIFEKYSERQFITYCKSPWKTPVKQIVFSKVAGLGHVALFKNKLLHRYLWGFSVGIGIGILRNTPPPNCCFPTVLLFLLYMEKRVTILFSLHSSISLNLSMFWK